MALSGEGWGSLPVLVSLGTTHWKTSIFPDKKSHTYLLPIKAAVRAKENLKVETEVDLAIEISSQL